MSRPANPFKIGLFVLLVLAGVVAIALGLGATRIKKNTLTYHTYFNESVQGLDVGSPVKFRGVTVGAVSAIEIAPDRRHVDVAQDLDFGHLRQMGLSDGVGPKRVPDDLRAQLASQGVTGVKFVAIDFFDPRANPPPELPFPVPDAYIPAARSIFKDLEETITKAMDKLPDLADAVVTITGRVDRLLAHLEEDDVTGRAVATLGHTDRVLSRLDGAIKHLDSGRLPEQTARTLGDVSRSSRELDLTLREVREAAQSIRVFADALERDPDMLFKGRAKAKVPK
jgi:phospholipid/cholesterol/gamma-HCH transport system substrate-binding protein